MNSVLYYPGFEIKDENWLKFALLYVRRLRPIIPTSGDRTLSDLTQYINEETDLFDFYRPSFEDSFRASDVAFDVMERIINNPQRYFRIFNTIKSIDYFKDKATHRFLLYNEKATYDFNRYCLRNGLATEARNGILLNPHLGNLYMTILANTIAEANNIQCITDVPTMDTYNIITRQSSTRSIKKNYYDAYEQKEYRIVKSIIESYLPENLSGIDLNTLIDFRNTSGFGEKLESFHREVDNYLSDIEKATDYIEFQEHLNKATGDLKKELMILTAQIGIIGVEVWSMINHGFTPENIATSAVAACTSIYTTNNIQRIIINGNDARFTRKYLASLRKRNNLRRAHK